MARITLKDYDTLQNGLRDLYAHHNLDTLPRAALKLSCALVPNDLCAYNEIDSSRRRLQTVLDPPSRATEYVALLPIWEQYMHQHPLLAHFKKNPTAGPHKISDFLSNAEFRKLELYTDCYRKIQANYQIAVNMPSPAPLTVAMAMNREKQDFDERDRKLLSLLQPHLRQAYENAAVISEIAGHLSQAYDVLDRIDRGMVVVDKQCRVRSASPAAIRFSVENFGHETEAELVKHLPDTLERWAKVQISALCQDGDQASRPVPLILDGQYGRLVIRATSDRQPGLYLLIMHLARPLESAEPLEDLGLTKREAEVLLGMVEGKSNSEIGIELSISDRTVDKHAENLYSKLDVAGRTEAVTQALEWLRL